MYQGRVYRRWVKSPDLVNFEVKEADSDLLISAEHPLQAQARDGLRRYRQQIEAYIKRRPEFESSLRPLAVDKGAADIVRQMQEAAVVAGVGPMAAVAGAIAEFVGRELLKSSSQVIVENGGDIFLKCRGRRRVALFSGEDSVWSRKLALEIDPQGSAMGICASSKTVGPSLSFGASDATVVVSHSAAVADAWATALGNRVKHNGDIDKVLQFGRGQATIKGVVIIVGDKIGMWGNFKLMKI